MSWKTFLARLFGGRSTPPAPATSPSLPALLHEIGQVLDNLARMPHPDPSVPRRLKRIRQELADLEAGCRAPAQPLDAVPAPPPTHRLQ